MKTLGLRWTTLVFLCVAVVACGDSDSSTTPTPVTPNFAGTWTGSGRLVQCTGSASVCAGSAPGATQSIEFVLTQSGTSVSRTWTTMGNEPRVPVTGSVATDGSLNLSGRLTTTGQPSVDSSRVTVAGTAMSGTLNFSLAPPNLGAGTFNLELVGVTRR